MICPIVLFYNESAMLPRCLDSLKWCDKVYAIDGRCRGVHDDNARGEPAHVSGLSYDGSREICESYGNVVLLDRPHTSFNDKITFGFAQFDDPADITWHIDADCYVTGDTAKFREECEAKSPYDGAVGLTYYYKTWKRNRSYEGEYNTLYLLLNPHGVRVHEKNHGIYVKSDGRILWPSFAIPHITIIHDDAHRPSAHAESFSKYHDSLNSMEVKWQEQGDMPRPSLLHRVRRRAMRVLNPSRYPKANPNLK